MTGVTHPGIHRQLKRTGLDAQSILCSSERRIPRCSSTMARMNARYSRDIPILTTNQSNVNIIADSLSRDFHKSDQTLTNIFNQILPQQTAALFQIKKLPRNVISLISSLAAASTLPTASPKPLRPSSLATGKGGEHSSNTQESQTNSWKKSHKRRKQSWCHHSLPQYDETSSEKQGNIYSST